MCLWVSVSNVTSYVENSKKYEGSDFKKMNEQSQRQEFTKKVRFDLGF